jgi:uncharacterized protein YggU (UPF0235/DUF167 family)
MKTIKVKVYPNKKETKVIQRKGRADIDLHIHLAAKAENNKANVELLYFLSQKFKVSANQIKIIKGSRSRIKEIAVTVKDATLS